MKQKRPMRLEGCLTPMPKLIQIHILDPGRHSKWTGNRLAYSVEPFTVAGEQGARVNRFRVTLKVGKGKQDFIFNDIKIKGIIDYEL